MREPITQCQCTNEVPCSTDMDGEDLLCSECRQGCNGFIGIVNEESVTEIISPESAMHIRINLQDIQLGPNSLLRFS